MVDFTKRTRLEQLLLRYYSIYWLRVFNTTLYFIVEIFLFIILTFLPIKVTFNYQLSSYAGVQQSLDFIILAVFLLHIYLYLDHSIKRLVQNPEITKMILFQSYVIKLKWLSIINAEFAYDLLCLIIAIYELIQKENTAVSRLLELVYLLKVYKIKIFHDRFLSYIIGTPFYIVYNVFYGLFILIIIVSYVGCAFFQLDKFLNNQNYPYPELLWVNVSAWPNIINDGFAIQLLYTMYWSLGTASSAAYGNVSASAPEDIVYNIICLYFEGFLFGFYLSRIHSLPQILSRKEDQLLEIFEQFEEHKEEIRKSKGERIDRKLYFKILCSLQYQEYRKKSVQEIEKLLPLQYLLQIKQHIFRDLLHASPMGLWSDQSLKRSLSLKLQEATTEAGELIYDYSSISRTDLVYIKQGEVTTSLQVDHSLLFNHTFRNFDFFGMFAFATGLAIPNAIAKGNNYCNLYLVKRADYKALLSLEQRIEFDRIFANMLAHGGQQADNQTMATYECTLAEGNSDIHFLNPERKSEYVRRALQASSEKNKHQRRNFRRAEVKSSKFWLRESAKTKNIGIQCSEEDTFLRDMDTVIIV